MKLDVMSGATQALPRSRSPIERRDTLAARRGHKVTLCFPASDSERNMTLQLQHLDLLTNAVNTFK